MLDLPLAARRAKERAHDRVQRALAQRQPPASSVAHVERNRSFRGQLLDASRRSREDAAGPIPAPDALFLSFPERILAKWYYLAYGTQRDSTAEDRLSGVEQSSIQTWKRWDAVGSLTRFRNFSGRHSKSMLVAHGLSPAQDTTLLLADIGRCVRAARATNLPAHVLLADVSWMSYNRSIRRLDFTEAEISDGLRVCLDRRTRLYKALGLSHTLHSIVPFATKGTIHEEKLNRICNSYGTLVRLLWGNDAADASGHYLASSFIRS